MTIVFNPGDVVVKIRRWPVLSRGTNPKTGRVNSEYKRTAEPTMLREEKLIRCESRSRVIVTWDIASHERFSLGTGRCIGSADWLLTEESLRELRKLARKEFPRKKKPAETVEASSEEAEDDEKSPMEIAKDG